MASWMVGASAMCLRSAATGCVPGAGTKPYFDSGMSSAIWMVFVRTVRKPLASCAGTSEDMGMPWGLVWETETEKYGAGLLIALFEKDLLAINVQFVSEPR